MLRILLLISCYITAMQGHKSQINTLKEQSALSIPKILVSLVENFGFESKVVSRSNIKELLLGQKKFVPLDSVFSKNPVPKYIAFAILQCFVVMEISGGDIYLVGDKGQREKIGSNVDTLPVLDSEGKVKFYLSKTRQHYTDCSSISNNDCTSLCPSDPSTAAPSNNGENDELTPEMILALEKEYRGLQGAPLINPAFDFPVDDSSEDQEELTNPVLLRIRDNILMSQKRFVGYWVQDPIAFLAEFCGENESFEEINRLNGVHSNEFNEGYLAIHMEDATLSTDAKFIFVFLGKCDDGLSLFGKERINIPFKSDKVPVWSDPETCTECDMIRIQPYMGRRC